MAGNSTVVQAVKAVFGAFDSFKSILGESLGEGNSAEADSVRSVFTSVMGQAEGAVNSMREMLVASEIQITRLQEQNGELQRLMAESLHLADECEKELASLRGEVQRLNESNSNFISKNELLMQKIYLLTDQCEKAKDECDKKQRTISSLEFAQLASKSNAVHEENVRESLQAALEREEKRCRSLLSEMSSMRTQRGGRSDVDVQYGDAACDEAPSASTARHARQREDEVHRTISSNEAELATMRKQVSTLEASLAASDRQVTELRSRCASLTIAGVQAADVEQKLRCSQRQVDDLIRHKGDLHADIRNLERRLLNAEQSRVALDERIRSILRTHAQMKPTDSNDPNFLERELMNAQVTAAQRDSCSCAEQMQSMQIMRDEAAARCELQLVREVALESVTWKLTKKVVSDADLIASVKRDCDYATKIAALCSEEADDRMKLVTAGMHMKTSLALQFASSLTAAVKVSTVRTVGTSPQYFGSEESSVAAARSAEQHRTRRDSQPLRGERWELQPTKDFEDDKESFDFVANIAGDEQRARRSVIDLEQRNFFSVLLRRAEAAEWWSIRSGSSSDGTADVSVDDLRLQTRQALRARQQAAQRVEFLEQALRESEDRRLHSEANESNSPAPHHDVNDDDDVVDLSGTLSAALSFAQLHDAHRLDVASMFYSIRRDCALAVVHALALVDEAEEQRLEIAQRNAQLVEFAAIPLSRKRGNFAITFSVSTQTGRQSSHQGASGQSSLNFTQSVQTDECSTIEQLKGARHLSTRTQGTQESHEDLRPNYNSAQRQLVELTATATACRELWVQEALRRLEIYRHSFKAVLQRKAEIPTSGVEIDRSKVSALEADCIALQKENAELLQKLFAAKEDADEATQEKQQVLHRTDESALLLGRESSAWQARATAAEDRVHSLEMRCVEIDAVKRELAELKRHQMSSSAGSGKDSPARDVVPKVLVGTDEGSVTANEASRIAPASVASIFSLDATQSLSSVKVEKSSLIEASALRVQASASAKQQAERKMQQRDLVVAADEGCNSLEEFRDRLAARSASLNAREIEIEEQRQRNESFMALLESKVAMAMRVEREGRFHKENCERRLSILRRAALHLISRRQTMLRVLRAQEQSLMELNDRKRDECPPNAEQETAAAAAAGHRTAPEERAPRRRWW